METRNDICVIILPKAVDNPLSPDLRPCKFKGTINYVDEQGKQQTFECGSFRTDPLRVDTIVLAKDFRFPVCNYNQVNSKVSVKLTCDIKARESSQYARKMYLDCIYLRPSNKEE